jgi:hypothetical protein
MKYIKTYQIFEANAAAPAALTEEQIEWLDKCTENSWRYNPSTGLVDVDRDFYCSGQNLQDFKGVRFGTVGWGFSCKNNQLTTLEGAPQSVGGDFNCYNNQLITLEGAPQSVGNSFNCGDNQLTTLVGAPQSVGGGFSCKNNQLTSLEGAPQRVGMDFDCRNNHLTSLVGAQQVINGSFDCGNNHITSLEGAPHKVDGDFYCYNNRLTSLEGAPQRVGMNFYYEANPVSEETLDAIFAKMQKGTSYLAAVESIWSELTQDDQVLLYTDDFKWVSPEKSRGLVALRAYQGLRSML